MGNVSLAMPSIHPMIGINPCRPSITSREFITHCITADADKAVIYGALAMAWTGIDMAQHQPMRDRPLARQS